MSGAANLKKDISAVGEFMMRMNSSVARNVVDAINSGRVELSDHTLYTARKIDTQQHVELCVADDAKKVGVCNFDRRRLEANMYMMVTGIRILSGVNEKVEECEFEPLHGAMLNGEIEFKQGNKIIISALSLQEFSTKKQNSEGGYYRLEAPFMLLPQTEFIPTIKLAKAGVQNQCIRIELHGVITRSR